MNTSLAGRAGSVELIVGCMGSGRHGELRRRLAITRRAGVPVAFLAPGVALAPRPVPDLRIDDGPLVKPIVCDDPARFAEVAGIEIGMIAIAEAHFYPDSIVEAVRTLAIDGFQVVVVGLDTDFRGHVFGPMGTLLAEADRATKLHAICVRCRGVATRTQRVVNGRPAAPTDPLIAGDGAVTYEPRCRACHQVPMTP
jgi:thymidine kinase